MPTRVAMIQMGARENFSNRTLVWPMGLGIGCKVVMGLVVLFLVQRGEAGIYIVRPTQHAFSECLLLAPPQAQSLENPERLVPSW